MKRLTILLVGLFLSMGLVTSYAAYHTITEAQVFSDKINNNDYSLTKEQINLGEMVIIGGIDAKYALLQFYGRNIFNKLLVKKQQNPVLTEIEREQLLSLSSTECTNANDVREYLEANMSYRLLNAKLVSQIKVDKFFVQEHVDELFKRGHII